MKEHLLSLANYNSWANRKIDGFIRSAGEERSALEQKSSFPTIRETLIHIWDAQSIWLDRLHGLPVTSWPGKSFQGSSSEAASSLVQNSDVWIDLVHTLDESTLKTKVYYTNITGDEFSNTWSQIISHVMNHGTYHRGQLVTMLRGAGLTALSSTDLITYYREHPE